MLNRLMALAIALLLSACNPAAQRAKLEHDRDTEAERPVIAPYIGHTYYLIGASQKLLCDRPDYYFFLDPGPNGPQCVRVSGKFTIDSYSGVEPTYSYTKEIRVHVTFEKGGPGYMGFDIAKPFSAYFTDHDTRYDVGSYALFLAHLKPAEAAWRLKLPGVVFEMTPDQVLASAWGAPLSKETRDPCHRRACTTTEQIWFYPENARVTFIDGKAAEIIRK